MSMEQLRKVEVIRDGKWVETPLREVVTGDTFRMFEPDGEPVEDQGQREFIASSDAFQISGADHWAVSVEDPCPCEEEQCASGGIEL